MYELGLAVERALCRAALGAFARAANEIKDQGTFSFAAEAISYAEVNDLMKGV